MVESSVCWCKWKALFADVKWNSIKLPQADTNQECHPWWSVYPGCYDNVLARQQWSYPVAHNMTYFVMGHGNVLRLNTDNSCFKLRTPVLWNANNLGQFLSQLNFYFIFNIICSFWAQVSYDIHRNVNFKVLFPYFVWIIRAENFRVWFKFCDLVYSRKSWSRVARTWQCD